MFHLQKTGRAWIFHGFKRSRKWSPHFNLICAFSLEWLCRLSYNVRDRERSNPMPVLYRVDRVRLFTFSLGDEANQLTSSSQFWCCFFARFSVPFLHVSYPGVVGALGINIGLWKLKSASHRKHRISTKNFIENIATVEDDRLCIINIRPNRNIAHRVRVVFYDGVVFSDSL